MKEINLALFDFDGTITTKDSLVKFIQYAVGKRRYYVGLVMISPMLMLYMLKFIPNDIAKQRLISHFFRGWDIDDFHKIATNYANEQIDLITRLAAIKQLRWHQERGDKVVIVSASVECWLKSWCDRYNIDLIATKLQIKDNKLTGKFDTPNCYGIEKVNRIKAIYNIKDYKKIYAYGDSSGDKDMLSLADESFYKPFRG